MDHQVLFDIFGWIASFGLILGYLPQAIQTIRTRNTDGISMPAFIMMAVGSFAFMCQGWMLGREGIFMLITNFITFTCSVIIFVIKIQNDRRKKQRKMNIAIFVSGSGSNCENLIKYFAGSETVKTALVVSNKADAYALVRAERLGVPTAITPKADLHNPDVMLPLLKQYNIDFIVLAGWLPLIPDFLIDAYPHRIINIHPALLPKYGGKGMWGHHVHEAVKAAGETETGMTVHWVTPVCDAGEIIAQYKVALSPEDTVDDIAEKEHQLEMEYFPKEVEKIIKAL